MSEMYEAACKVCGQTFKLFKLSSDRSDLFRCTICGEEHQIFSPTLKEMIGSSVKCNCGGNLSADAPPRCPLCLSTDITTE